MPLSVNSPDGGTKVVHRRGDRVWRRSSLPRATDSPRAGRRQTHALTTTRTRMLRSRTRRDWCRERNTRRKRSPSPWRRWFNHRGILTSTTVCLTIFSVWKWESRTKSIRLLVQWPTEAVPTGPRRCPPRGFVNPSPLHTGPAFSSLRTRLGTYQLLPFTVAADPVKLK